MDRTRSQRIRIKQPDAQVRIQRDGADATTEREWRRTRRHVRLRGRCDGKRNPELPNHDVGTKVLRRSVAELGARDRCRARCEKRQLAMQRIEREVRRIRRSYGARVYRGWCRSLDLESRKAAHEEPDVFHLVAARRAPTGAANHGRMRGHTCLVEVIGWSYFGRMSKRVCGTAEQ